MPVVHPNIHPDTGFVCLWDRHRVSNTVEHALHKLAAMLAGELQNTTPMHVMQPGALGSSTRYSPSMPLLGVVHDTPLQMAAATARRQRLQ